ncbi:MAG TPA: ribose 5-phosphate isomerase A [Rubrobacter sp.]|nr:ribose 5-phosphate isomerase A [Rubrobacter sp.]
MKVAPEILRSTAHAAVDARLESGMTVGLGSGTAASLAVERIGELLSSGELEDVRGIPTSEKTARLAREVGIPLLDLSASGPDVTIDGADEIGEGNLSLIKGHGGALLREKIVASCSYLVVVADASKLVNELGRGSIPVEVEPFGWEATVAALSSLGCEATLRRAPNNPELPFVTDGGHFTVDCMFGPMPDPASLEAEIRRIPGALECGIFVDLARVAYVAHEAGTDIMEA